MIQTLFVFNFEICRGEVPSTSWVYVVFLSCTYLARLSFPPHHYLHSGALTPVQGIIHVMAVYRVEVVSVTCLFFMS